MEVPSTAKNVIKDGLQYAQVWCGAKQAWIHVLY